MATRPEPPANPDTAAELAAYVSQHPEDWMFYLRNMEGYAASMEEENATLRAAVRNHDPAISPLQTEITKNDAIIGCQEKQLSERNAEANKIITRLEVERIQLLAAATPMPDQIQMP